MRDPAAISPVPWIIVLGGAVAASILVTAVRFGIAALDPHGDRAAANQTLRLTAGLLGGRFRDRREYPWYRRPAKYGAVEGELGRLGDLAYELYLMPRNAEDCGGAAMLRIRSLQGPRLAGSRSALVAFTPEKVWHWPDLADPGTLASYVRQAIAAADSGDLPPGS